MDGMMRELQGKMGQKKNNKLWGKEEIVARRLGRFIIREEMRKKERRLD